MTSVCTDCGFIHEDDVSVCEECGSREVYDVERIIDMYHASQHKADEDNVWVEEFLERNEEVLELVESADDRIDDEGWDYEDYYIDPEEELMFDE
jgi:hypothetical protein